MATLIPTLPPTAFKFLLLAIYTLGWYLIYMPLASIFPDRKIRLKLVTAGFYCLISTTFAGLLFYDHLRGAYEMTSTQVHFLLIIVGFYLFATIEELRTKRTYHWSLILHHFAFGSIILFYAILANIPSTYLWLVAVQFSSIFVSVKSVLKIFPKYFNQQLEVRLNEADFWCFLMLRILLQTLMMLYGMYEMYQLGTINVLIPIGVLVAMGLNVSWFSTILARRRKVGRLVIS